MIYIYIYIINAYQRAGGDVKTFPTIPKSVGGEIDFTIGIKFLRYYPKVIFQLSSTLTIDESVSENTYVGKVIRESYTMFNSVRRY